VKDLASASARRPSVGTCGVAPRSAMLSVAATVVVVAAFH
jgi:hypothetical protein